MELFKMIVEYKKTSFTMYIEAESLEQAVNRSWFLENMTDDLVGFTVFSGGKRVHAS
jgi:hypothetical protein